MTDTGLHYDVEDAVAVLRIDRLERRNSFTFEMIEAWTEAMRAAREDPEVRVVVLTGTGDAFCAGIDLALLEDVAEGTALERKTFLSERIHLVGEEVLRLDKPLIAAINGVAVGAGLDMALMCDIRFAARSARMAESYVRHGLVPGDGGAWLLPRLVGPGKALELLLSGDLIDGAEAERIGLVNRAYPDEELWDATMAFARHIAAQPPVAVRMIKRAVYQGATMDLRTAFDMVSSHMSVAMATEDHLESRLARKEKRDPRFLGR